jgi:hypothetical protein
MRIQKNLRHLIRDRGSSTFTHLYADLPIHGLQTPARIQPMEENVTVK